jgi:hypothetical protein
LKRWGCVINLSCAGCKEMLHHGVSSVVYNSMAHTDKEMSIMNALCNFIRRRGREKGMSVSEICKSAGKSRQTFYAMNEPGARLPDIETLLDFAVALDVHPMRLMQLVFEGRQGTLCRRHERMLPRDVSQFVRDVTVADGAVVMAGARFEKSWEVLNAGSTIWEGRFLQCMDDDLVVITDGIKCPVVPRLVPDTRRIAVPRTAPGAAVILSVPFTAPDVPGTCVSYWKSVASTGEVCFPEAVGLSVQVRVIALEHTGMRRSELQIERSAVLGP